MSRILHITASFLLLAGFLHAQPTQTLRGTVIDRDSKVPVVGANVVVLGLHPFRGSSTDIDGDFRIEEVPVGRYDVKVSYLGYEEKVIPGITVSSGHETILNIELVESVVGLKAVEVTADKDPVKPVNEMSVVSTRSFSVEQTQRYAGSFDDPSRMAMAYAGVTAGAEDEDNEIVIRGNSPRGLLWRVEGVEVPSPNHFSDEGSSSGSISIIPSHMLATSDFSTGAFPAEYGNALSGVFDIKLRKGNNEQREFSLETSLVGLEFAMEGPFVKGGKASYLANYRYSTLALVSLMGLPITDNILPVFQDLSLKVNVPTKRYGQFTIFGIGGMSSLNDKDDGTREDGTQGLKYDETYGSDMMAAGVSNNYIINKKMYVHSTLAFTGQQVRFNEKRYVSDTTALQKDFEQYTNMAAKALVTLNNKFSARHHLKSGIIYSHLYFDLFAEELSLRRLNLRTDIDDNGHTDLLQAFTSWRFRVNESLTFTAGVHGMYFFLNGNYAIEPRAGMRWQINSKQALSAGIGLHSRMEGLSVYLNEVIDKDGNVTQPNRNLDFTRAVHYVVGYDNRLAPNLHLKVELYYQDLFNVPIEEEGAFSAINKRHGFTKNKLYNKGTGENYGIEITLEKFFARHYFLMINGSLFDSKYVGADGVKRDTRFNTHFVTNFLAGKDFEVGRDKQNVVMLSARATVAGGKRYTPLDEERSLATGKNIEDDSNPYSEQGPVYYRIDFSTSFTKNRPRASLTWKLDVQNVTNNKNIEDIEFDEERGIVKDMRGQILPVFSFKVGF